MFSEDKNTEIFYLADNFCKFFKSLYEKSVFESSKNDKK